MKLDHPSFVQMLSWLFCAFASINLLHDWVDYPALHWSRTAFCLWFTPVIVYWLYPEITKPRQANSLFFGIGIIFSLLGSLGELNVLKNLGFLIATAGLIPWSWTQLFWLTSGLVWLPASSYLFRALPFNLIIILRLCLVTLGAGIEIWNIFYPQTLWNENENE